MTLATLREKGAELYTEWWVVGGGGGGGGGATHNYNDRRRRGGTDIRGHATVYNGFMVLFHPILVLLPWNGTARQEEREKRETFHPLPHTAPQTGGGNYWRDRQAERQKSQRIQGGKGGRRQAHTHTHKKKSFFPSTPSPSLPPLPLPFCLIQ